jgi:hypothetical protein
MQYVPFYLPQLQLEVVVKLGLARIGWSLGFVTNMQYARFLSRLAI